MSGTILIRELPETNPTDDTKFVGIQGNASVLISWDSVKSELPTMSLSQPTSVSDSSSNTLSLGTFFFANTDNGWGKVPVYLDNWDDLTSTTRFLRVDSEMELSESEKDVLTSTLGIGIATSTTPGTVMGSDTVSIASDGSMSVTKADVDTHGIVKVSDSSGVVATTFYVDSAIDNVAGYVLPVATDTTLGGILPSATLQVSTGGQASVPVATSNTDSYGLVKVNNNADTDTYPDSSAWVPTTEYVNLLISDAINTELPYATSSTAGVIVPSSNFTITDGVLYCNEATASTYGTTRLVTSITSDIITAMAEDVTIKNRVPTLEAVTTYVAAGLDSQTISAASLPKATTSTLGAVIASETVQVSSTGQVSVPLATSLTRGVVFIVDSKSSISDTMSGVTTLTASAVFSLIESLESTVESLEATVDDLTTRIEALENNQVEL